METKQHNICGLPVITCILHDGDHVVNLTTHDLLLGRDLVPRQTDEVLDQLKVMHEYDKLRLKLNNIPIYEEVLCPTHLSPFFCELVGIVDHVLIDYYVKVYIRKLFTMDDYYSSTTFFSIKGEKINYEKRKVFRVSGLYLIPDNNSC